MSDDVRAKLVARLNAPPAPPVEAVGKFLRIYFSDDSDEEAHQSMRADAAQNPRPVQLGLEGLDSLLANPPAQPGILADLVSWEANRRLEDPSDAGAREWLARVAQTASQLLGEQPPLRSAT